MMRNPFAFNLSPAEDPTPAVLLRVPFNIDHDDLLDIQRTIHEAAPEVHVEVYRHALDDQPEARLQDPDESHLVENYWCVVSDEDWEAMESALLARQARK